MLTIPYTSLTAAGQTMPAGQAMPQIPVLQAATYRPSLAAQNATSDLNAMARQQNDDVHSSILDYFRQPAPVPQQPQPSAPQGPAYTFQLPDMPITGLNGRQTVLPGQQASIPWVTLPVGG